MATTINDAISHIIKAFSGELGPDALAQAPKLFAQMATAPGLAPTLITFLQNPATYSVSERLHAATLLKRLISDNWSVEGDAVTEQEESILENAHVSPEAYQMATEIAQLRGLQSEISDADKDFVKNALPGLLGDDQSAIRTNVALSIATIGSHDFPDKWPQLLDGLIGAAQNENVNIVQGALLCFNSILDTVLDVRIQTLAPQAFGTILNILSNPTSLPAVRTQALDLYSAFIQSFSFSEDPAEKGFEKKFNSLLLPTLPQLVSIILMFIDAPFDISNVNSCQFEVRGAAVKAITRLLTYFPVTTKSAVEVQNVVLDRMAAAFAAGAGLYVETLASCPAEVVVEDGIVAGLTFFLNCVIACLDIMAESTKHFPKFVLNKLDKFVPALCQCLLFGQIEIENYQDDVNKFTTDEMKIDFDTGEGHVSDAEQNTPVRTESLRFLKIAVEKWFKTASALVVQSANQLWAQGSALKAVSPSTSKSMFWWKYHEAALVGIGAVMGSEKGYSVEIVQQTFPLPAVVDMIYGLTTAVSGNPQEVYLQARGMWLLGNCIRKLTADLTSQLHKTKQYEQANITQQLIYKCLNMLPVAISPQAPIETRITTAHAISTCQQSFLAIDHSVLFYQCQQLDQQFYSQHPQLKVDYDRCMASGEEIPLQPQFVNTIPLQFQSGFAQHFPVFLEHFCDLLDHVQDDGTSAIMNCVSWIFGFFQQWHDHLIQLCDTYPYVQFTTTPPASASAATPGSPSQPRVTGTLLPHLQPHAAALTAELMTKVVAKVLDVWVKNSNDSVLGEIVVEIFHSISALKNNHIESWAASAYNFLVSFIKNTPTETTSTTKENEFVLSDAGAKLAAIGFISIILRSLSPGPYFESTTTNLDPSKQTAIPLIASIQQLQETVQNTPNSFQPLTISQIIPAEEIINNFLPSVVNLGVTGQDKHLAYAALAISASILAMYSPYLLQLYTPNQQQQQQPPHPQLFPMLESLALLLIRTNGSDAPEKVPGQTQSLQDILQVDDKDAPIACRVIAQLLITYKAVIGDQSWKNLLNVVIMKLCTTTEHTLRFSCIWILSRVGIHHCQALITYLATECGTIEVKKLVKKGEMVKSVKTGRFIQKKDEYAMEQEPIFFRTIDVLLESIANLTSGYVRRIALMFLCQCMSDARCVELLSGLKPVRDELIEMKSTPQSGFAAKLGGMTTRSKAIVVEQWSHCNAVTKMLKLLCERGYNALVLSIDQLDETDADGLGLHDDDDSDDDEEESAAAEDSAANAALTAMFGAKLGAKMQQEEFSLDEIFGDDEEENDADDYGEDRTDYPESAYDRFYGVDVAHLVSSFVQVQEQLMQQNQGPFALAKNELGPAQMSQVLALKDPVGFAQHHRLQKKMEKQQNQSAKQ